MSWISPSSVGSFVLFAFARLRLRRLFAASLGVADGCSFRAREEALRGVDGWSSLESITIVYDGGVEPVRSIISCAGVCAMLYEDGRADSRGEWTSAQESNRRKVVGPCCPLLGQASVTHVNIKKYCVSVTDSQHIYRPTSLTTIFTWPFTPETMSSTDFEISISHLTYSHKPDDPPSLIDISIYLPKGSRTILVGANGGMHVV